MFIMCKHLNGPDQAVRAEIGKKLIGPGPGQNFVFRFGPGRARAEISISLSGRAEPAPGQNYFLYFGPDRAGPEPEKSVPCRPLVPGSLPGCACRPGRLDISVVFSETRINTG